MKQFIILSALVSIVTCAILNNEYLPSKGKDAAIVNGAFGPTSRGQISTEHAVEENGFQPEVTGVPVSTPEGPSAFVKTQFAPTTFQQQYEASVAPKPEYGVASVPLQKSATSEFFPSSTFPIQQQFSGNRVQLAPQQPSTFPKFQPSAQFSSQNQFNAPVPTLYGVPLAPQVQQKFQPGVQQFDTPTTGLQSGSLFTPQFATGESVAAKTQFPGAFGSQQLGQIPTATQYNAPSQVSVTPKQQYGAPSTQTQFGTVTGTYGLPSTAEREYQIPFGGTSLVGVKTPSFQQYSTTASQIDDSSAAQGPKSQFEILPQQRSAFVLPKEQFGTVQDSQGGYKY